MEPKIVERVKYTVPKCNCKALRIGKAKTNGWLCEHNTLGIVVSNIKDYWGAKNDLTPFDYTVKSNKKVWIDCKKCGSSEEKHPTTVGSYTIYVCDVCHRNENNAARARPELVRYVNDGTDISKVACHSRQVISWKCPDCDREWDSMMTTMFGNTYPCKKCAGLIAMTFEEFVEKSNIVHDEFYNYYLTPDFKAVNEIRINCPVHGDFHQIGYNHAKGHGCHGCANVVRVTYDIFIQRSTEIHNGKYQYPPIDWTFRIEDKIDIFCPIHGYFCQRGSKHMRRGQGCKLCNGGGGGGTRLTYTDFLSKSLEVHEKYYHYPLVEPPNFSGSIKIEIWCPQHGVFLQKARNHANGCKCRSCGGGSSKGSDEIARTLRELNIVFEREKPYPGMVFRMSLYCDFAEIILTRGKFTTRLIIEFDGKQHFVNVPFFKKRDESLRRRMTRDKIKDKYAVESGFSLIRIPYTEIKNLRQIIIFFLACPHEKQFIYTYSHYMDNLKDISRDILIFEVACPKIDWSDID